MKITVRNLGPIRNEATFDLKPLTVFIGQNDSGKTWLAYVTASIFGPYGMEKYIQAYIDGLVPQIYEPLHRAIEQVQSEGSASIDVRQFAVDYGEAYFNAVAAFAPTWMSEFLSTQLLRFADLDVSVQLAGNREQFINAIVYFSQLNRIATGQTSSLLTLRKKRGENNLFVYTANATYDAEEQEEQGRTIESTLLPEVVKEQIITFVLGALHRSLYPYVRIFPVEKATLVTDRFSERILEHTKLNEAVQETIHQVIWPVQSFVTMLSLLFNVGTRQQEEREKRAQNDTNIRKYREYAELLEREVLLGEIKFSTPEPNPRRQLLFQPSSDVVLEIPIASSMVKELASLVLYLRYLARPEELLIIDEPEMNLHPAAQMEMIEFLALLVNAGLNVLITTHSSYVVDHLINLMEAFKHENQDDIVDMFLLQQKESFISQEKISVYQIEGGEVKDILDAEGNIDWRTFSDVTQLMGRIHFEL